MRVQFPSVTPNLLGERLSDNSYFSLSLDDTEPHMDGSCTVSMAKYFDKPGQIKVTLPAPFISDLRNALAELDELRSTVAKQKNQILLNELDNFNPIVDYDSELNLDGIDLKEEIKKYRRDNILLNDKLDRMKEALGEQVGNVKRWRNRAHSQSRKLKKSRLKLEQLKEKD